MAYRKIGTGWDENMRADIDTMFKELFREYTQAGLDAAEAREKAVKAVTDALYAKELAETTRDELERIVREQTAGGDIIPEVVQARGSESTLGNRLNSISQDLAQKADEYEVRSDLNKKRDKAIPISLNDVNEDLLAAIQGGEETTFNLLSIPRDNSVTPEKTTFIDKSTNLFDKNNVINGFSLSSTDGSNVGNPDYSVTDYFIDVDPVTYVFSPTPFRWAVYDDNYKFIESAISNTFTVPENGRYVKLAVRTDNLSTAQLNKGETLLPYEPFYVRISRNIEVPTSEGTGMGIGNSFFGATRTDAFSPEENFEIVNLTGPVIIDAIDWFPRNETEAKIVINILGGGSTFINPLGNGTVSGVSAKDVLDGLSLYWEVIKYDTTVTPDPIVRFHLKEPIYCPQGVIITLQNTSAEATFRNSCQVRGRIL